MEKMFTPKMPTQIDTLYYPFYDGVQMIEVDHIGHWDKKIFFLEQSQPRAMPHSMLHPMPQGNHYFFRDTTGAIVKSYNGSSILPALTQHFSSIPIDQKSKGIRSLLRPYHSSTNGVNEGVWVYSPQSMFSFGPHYKVYDSPMVDTHFGLIDTLGNIMVPMIYDEILPLRDKLLVKKKGLWGVMDYTQHTLVPMRYDSYHNYYALAQNNKYLYFRKAGQFVAIYSVLEDKLVKTDSYDELFDHHVHHGYFQVSLERHYGLIDLEGKVIVPPIYTRINNLNVDDCDCASVTKDGKTFNLPLSK